LTGLTDYLSLRLGDDEMPPQEINVSVRNEDGSYWATVDQFPGVFATGDDLEELRESLEEGISLVLAGPDEDPVPIQLAPLVVTSPETLPPSAASAALVYA
jgi:predicted RNase H-like HicB family nuclease